MAGLVTPRQQRAERARVALDDFAPDAEILNIYHLNGAYAVITRHPDGTEEAFTGPSVPRHPNVIRYLCPLNARTPQKELRRISHATARTLTPPPPGGPLLETLHALTATPCPEELRPLLRRVRAIIPDSERHEGWARLWRSIHARRALTPGSIWRNAEGHLTVVQDATTAVITSTTALITRKAEWAEFVDAHAPSTPALIPINLPTSPQEIKT